jgi:FKBP-type peptidyl-prolyl cis-trans isomerase
MKSNKSLNLTLNIFLSTLLVLASCTKKSETETATQETPPTDTTTTPTDTAKTETTGQPTTATGGTNMDVTELKIEDVTVGSGVEAKTGKAVTVHYTGRLLDGTKFDSSHDRNSPFTFNLGAGEVIQGWDKGVAGMKIGGKRKLTIPSALGYGARGAGGVIPPNAGLVFDVELLGVK